MRRTLPVLVRIQYLPPGFTAADAQVAFRVDGGLVADGSMRTDVWGELHLAPGTHQLHATLAAGFLTRKKEWTFEVPDVPESTDVPRLDVIVRYSRTWGTFAKELEVVQRESSEPSAPAEPEEPHAADAPVRATWILVAMLVACFGLEHVAAITPAAATAPSIETLYGLGGLDVPSTTSGQWFRLLACPFLHADILHLLCNAIAIVMAGFLIERRLGWRWLTALYLVGGVGGSLVSLASNDGHTLSVGASGAAMALFGGGLFVAQTLPRAMRMPNQIALLRVLVPSLVPAFASKAAGRVDFGAHLGGTLTGLALGAILLLAYRRAERHHEGIARFRKSAIALVALAPFVIALPATAYGVVHVAYPEARAEADKRAALLPDAELGEAAPTPEQTASWVQRYPEDPRGLLYAAHEAERADDADAAIAHAEHVKRNLPRFSSLFPESTIAALRDDADEVVRRTQLWRRLVPNRELAGPVEQLERVWKEHLSEWQRLYPDDPRVLMHAAERAIDTARFHEVEPLVSHALAMLPELEGLLHGEDLIWRLQIMQAFSWLELKDARATALLARLCSGELGQAAAEIVAKERACPK